VGKLICGGIFFFNRGENARHMHQDAGQRFAENNNNNS